MVPYWLSEHRAIRGSVTVSLLSGGELLFVLLIIGILFFLGLRLRTRTYTTVLLLVIALLLFALMSMGRLAWGLFSAVVLLGALLVLFTLLSISRSLRK